MRRAGARRAMVVLAATGWTGGWVGCISLKDDGIAVSVGMKDDATAPAEGGPPATTDGWTDVRSGDAETDGDGGTETDADPDADGGTGADADLDADGGAGTDADLDADASPAGILWPNDVPVCWYSPLDEAAFESPSDSQAHWIHDAVESNWGHEANLRFGAWPLCATAGQGPSPEVLILPSADAGDAADAGEVDAQWGGQVEGVGTETGSSPADPPRITFLPLAPDNVDTAPRERSMCAANRIFSRVLGLADDPAAQPLDATYCGDVSDPTGNRLSPLQILRAREAYGPKPSGSVVGFDGRCLTAATEAAGAIVQTDDCVPQATGVASSDQRWMYDPWGGTLHLVESGLALDSAGAAIGEQSIVRNPDPESPNQVWTTTAAAVRGIAGTCLDFQYTAGGDLRTVLWPCGRSIATQRVDFGASGSIRAASDTPDSGGASCLTVSGSTVGPAACDGTAAQGWRLAQGGAIQSLFASGQCLEAAIDPQNPEVGIEEGISLQVAPCSGATAQRFDIFGVLQNVPTDEPPRCLDVDGYARADRTIIWTWSCAVNDGVIGNENDWWDINW
jgi:hypothetical protein